MKGKMVRGIGGLLVGSVMALSGCSDDGLVYRKGIDSEYSVARYEDGRRVITKTYGPFSELFTDMDGDNRIDEYTYIGGFRVVGPLFYTLSGNDLLGRNFKTEEGILRDEKDFKVE